ncbi:aldolase/citrate lyase family protein [Lysinibacillus sp. NPDC096418]|uniref:aldolase/citrate lyase family protein n=1 Tax=Lysinibacillus sp. NPDC096418 TaxID=3364138 RepID=UPI00381DFEFD
MKLMFITNNPEVSQIAQDAGVDIIFVDLEHLGKLERQGHLNTFISSHTIDDVGIIKKSLNQAELLVRVNPINKNSEKEIEKVLENTPDYIMLPMFRTKEEVETFIRIVNKRSKIVLLLETAAALVRIDDILMLDGIDVIYVGLNDLHLELGLDFMFEILSEGIIDCIAHKAQAKGIDFGFGGIAKLNQGDVPAELIIKEHERLKSEMVILSRSFIANRETIDNTELKNVSEEVKKLRNVYLDAADRTESNQKSDYSLIVSKIRQKAKELRNRNV